MIMAPDPHSEPLLLKAGDSPAKQITTMAELRLELAELDRLRDGQSVLLQRTPKHYIRAIREGALWSASYRNGGFWTVKGFSTEGTTEYCDRKAKESRAAGTLRNRIRVALASPPPECALTTKQIQDLFESYLCGTKFPIAPGMGAG
jgi:hypothetical protein